MKRQMSKVAPRIDKSVVLVVVLVISALLVINEYFPEATFELASESRLPGWITLPQGLTRADVSLTMNYYAVPWRRAKFILQDKNKQTIEKKNGKMRCSASFELKDPPRGFPPGYPAYEAITVNGVTEIIEHRKMEPIFYVTDDPVVWKQYRSIGC
jgi:hypothetical protein